MSTNTQSLDKNFDILADMRRLTLALLELILDEERALLDQIPGIWPSHCDAFYECIRALDVRSEDYLRCAFGPAADPAPDASRSPSAKPTRPQDNGQKAVMRRAERGVGSAGRNL